MCAHVGPKLWPFKVDFLVVTVVSAYFFLRFYFLCFLARK